MSKRDTKLAFIAVIQYINEKKVQPRNIEIAQTMCDLCRHWDYDDTKFRPVEIQSLSDVMRDSFVKDTADNKLTAMWATYMNELDKYRGLPFE